MSKIIVLLGLCDKEKSAWAKEWVKNFPECRVRISKNAVYDMVGPYYHPSREQLVNSIYKKSLEETMLLGYDIVIDNTNTDEVSIREIEKEVQEFNEWIDLSPLNIYYETEYKDISETDI